MLEINLIFLTQSSENRSSQRAYNHQIPPQAAVTNKPLMIDESNGANIAVSSLGITNGTSNKIGGPMAPSVRIEERGLPGCELVWWQPAS